MGGVYDFSSKLLNNQLVPLKQFDGMVLLIVNTASACGFTPQYEGLETLQRTYDARGFSVLAFPCNQFGRQEPGSADEISLFCTERYQVSFPVFAKSDVNGPSASPLFAYLKSQTSGWLGPSIKWNFTKFLIDRRGAVVNRFAPITKPASLTSHIEALL